MKKSLIILFLVLLFASTSNAITYDLTFTNVGTIGGTTFFRADLTGLALVLFFSGFVMIIIRTYRSSQKDVYKAIERLTLEGHQ